MPPDRRGDQLAHLELHLGPWLEQLASLLRSGEWRPGSLRRVDIPKPHGGVRSLKIPNIADRVVERAIADAVIRRVDHLLAPASFAFRVGRGVSDAVRELAWLREHGDPWVVRADFADCFGSIEHRLLLDTVEDFVDDAWFTDVVETLLGRGEWWNGRFSIPAEGIPQGSPLSPLLCNLYLDAFDRSIGRLGIPMVRYADDFTLTCEDDDDALEARQAAVREAGRIGLSLSFEKTRVVAFDRGFVFLGEEIGPVLPSSNPKLVSEDAGNLRRSLYVTIPGSAATLRAGQVVVRHNNADAFTAPVSMVASLVTVGPVGITAGLRNHLVLNDIDTSFLSMNGNWLGRLDNGQHPSAAALRAQAAVSSDPTRRLEVARHLVEGKVANLRALLQRYGRRENVTVLAEVVDRLDAALVSARSATDLAALLGVEGAATREYFAGLRALLPPHAGFVGRGERPARDPANAALNYGYGVLRGECVSAVRRAGLLPALGYFHDDDDRRPSLALDLMEEFRPLVVDTVVIELFRRGILKPVSFSRQTTNGAVSLTEDGRRRLLGALEERLLTSTTHAATGTQGSLRRTIVLQARQLARVAIDADHRYQSQPWR
jgi:CRISPR-associated protein Cas1